jgi:hypothetical protein
VSARADTAVASAAEAATGCAAATSHHLRVKSFIRPPLARPEASRRPTAAALLDHLWLCRAETLTLSRTEKPTWHAAPSTRAGGTSARRGSPRRPDLPVVAAARHCLAVVADACTGSCCLHLCMGSGGRPTAIHGANHMEVKQRAGPAVSPRARSSGRGFGHSRTHAMLSRLSAPRPADSCRRALRPLGLLHVRDAVESFDL